jgi:hypothetical protein
MASAIGISVSSVQPIWRAPGLRPHQIRTFMLSNDPSSPQIVHSISSNEEGPIAIRILEWLARHPPFVFHLWERTFCALRLLSEGAGDGDFYRNVAQIRTITGS